MADMTDIEVLEREMQCVQRKAQINCTNCGSCGLRMDDERILTAYANAIAALRSHQEAEKNEPLTLDELREMDGHPVFLIPLGVDSWYNGDWALVDLKYELCRTTLGGLAVFENCGKTWAAYRRAPERNIQK